MDEYFIMTFLFCHLMTFREGFQCVGFYLHDRPGFIHKGSTLKM